MVEVGQVSDPRDVTRETAGEAKHLDLQTGQWHEQTHRPPDSATKLTQAMTLSPPSDAGAAPQRGHRGHLLPVRQRLHLLHVAGGGIGVPRVGP